MTSSMFYTKHDRGLTVYVDGESAAVSDSHPQYADILVALKKKDFSKARSLMKVGEVIGEAADAAFKGKKQRITVAAGNVWYTGVDGAKQKLKGPLVDRIVDTVKGGGTVQAVKPLMLFMDNVMKNKRKDIRDELYEFLLSGKMPITNDGHFLAYKKVRNDYLDCHSGTMDNSVGKLVAMKATDVDTNRHNVCSTGLHFCSRSYLSSFDGERTMIVKVNPRNVFAIPTDYNNAKGRASEYFVVGECTGNPAKDEAFIRPFVYDETKAAAAPSVKFIDSMKESLKARAEGYDLCKDDLAYVRVADTKGKLRPEKYTIVRKEGKTFVSAITGKDVPKQHVLQMSITTKSVRSALVRACAKARHR